MGAESIAASYNGRVKARFALILAGVVLASSAGWEFARAHRAPDAVRLSDGEVDHWLAGRKGQVAVITGASGGFGRALALEAARLGMRAVLADVKFEGSDELAREIRSRGGEAFAVRTDLRNAKDRARLVQEALARYGAIDLLINNAGYVYASRAEETDLRKAREQFEVNFWAQVDLVQRVIPIMKKEKGGLIANVGSIVAFVPEYFPGPVGIYAASKAAIRIWSRDIAGELKSSNIRIKVIHPAGMKTNLFKNSEGPDAAVVQRNVNPHWDQLDSPESIAKASFREFAQDSLEIFPGSALSVYRAGVEQGL